MVLTIVSMERSQDGHSGEIELESYLPVLLNGWGRFLYLHNFFCFEQRTVNCKGLNIYRSYYCAVLNAAGTSPNAARRWRLVPPRSKAGLVAPERCSQELAALLTPPRLVAASTCLISKPQKGPIQPQGWQLGVSFYF